LDIVVFTNSFLKYNKGGQKKFMKFEIFAISFTNFWQIKKAKTFGEKNSAFFFSSKGGRHLHLCQSINSVSKNSVSTPVCRDFKNKTEFLIKIFIIFFSFWWGATFCLGLLFKNQIRFQLTTLFHLKKSRQFRVVRCSFKFRFQKVKV